MRKYLNTLIKEYGGIPANAATDYKKGFRKGFMAQCKQLKKTEKLKAKSKKTKSKKR